MDAAGPAISLASLPVVLAMAQYFIVNFTTFLCLSWMQPYLKQKYGLSQRGSRLLRDDSAGSRAVAQWGTGAAVDRLCANMRYRPWSRRLPAMLGFLISAVAIAAIPSAATIQAGVCWLPSPPSARNGDRAQLVLLPRHSEERAQQWSVRR